MQFDQTLSLLRESLARARLSLCVIYFTSIFLNFVRGAKNKSIVVVVSPLTALMKDQVSTITKIGLSGANGSHSKARELMSCSCPLNPLIHLRPSFISLSCIFSQLSYLIGNQGLQLSK